MSMNVFGVFQNSIHSLKISLCYIEYNGANIYHSQNFSAFVFVHSIQICILEFYYTYINILYVKIVLYSKLYGQEQNLSSSLFTEILVITKLFIKENISRHFLQSNIE